MIELAAFMTLKMKCKQDLKIACCIFSLQNILGQYAEWCEPFPLVTSAHNGGFLILEVQKTEVYPWNDHSSYLLIQYL